MPNLSVRIGRRVRYLRTERGVSQQMLADRADLSRINLSRIENGKAEAGIATLLRIAKALGVRLVDLLEGVD